MQWEWIATEWETWSGDERAVSTKLLVGLGAPDRQRDQSRQGSDAPMAMFTAHTDFNAGVGAGVRCEGSQLIDAPRRKSYSAFSVAGLRHR